MKRIFSARDGGKYDVGNIDTLSVYTEFHSSSFSSPAPIDSGSRVRMLPTKFKLLTLMLDFGALWTLDAEGSSALVILC